LLRHGTIGATKLINIGSNRAAIISFDGIYTTKGRTDWTKIMLRFKFAIAVVVLATALSSAAKHWVCSRRARLIRETRIQMSTDVDMLALRT